MRTYRDTISRLQIKRVGIPPGCSTGLRHIKCIAYVALVFFYHKSFFLLGFKKTPDVSCQALKSSWVHKNAHTVHLIEITKCIEHLELLFPS